VAGPAACSLAVVLVVGGLALLQGLVVEVVRHHVVVLGHALN
jgi:hypothetical protein